MTDADHPLDRMSALFERWITRHGERSQKQAIGVLKGQVAARKAAQERTVRWARDMLPLVEQARNELGGGMTNNALADWLNECDRQTATGNRFVGRNLGTTLFAVDKSIIADAVMECRAQMSALALSADFRVPVEDARPLEIRCIERIKEGIALARELERRHPLSDDDLTVEARQQAIYEAERQRSDGKYAPMLARECYLTDAEFDEAVPDIERMILANR